MKQVVEGYIVVMGTALMIMLAIAFTGINIHVSQARRIYSDIKAEIQASNGAYIEESGLYTRTSNTTLADDGFSFNYKVTRESISNGYITSNAETYIYNDIYRIELEYVYAVPIFGRQIYPITGYAY